MISEDVSVGAVVTDTETSVNVMDSVLVCLLILMSIKVVEWLVVTDSVTVLNFFLNTV